MPGTSPGITNWLPVAFSSEVKTGSRQENAPIKKLEPVSILSKRAPAALPQQHLCDTHGAEPTQETRHDRLRPRPASHGAATTLVRGFCAGRALCHSEPHHDIGRVRRVSDRERRYPSRALRCRILPRPRHAEPARAWFPDADPYRTGQRTVSPYGGGIAGRVSRTVEPVPETRVRRRHDLSRARGDGASAWPHHGRGGIAQHRVQSAPRAGAGRTAEVSHSPADRSAVI